MKNSKVIANKTLLHIKVVASVILVCLVVIYGIKVTSQTQKKGNDKINTEKGQASVQDSDEVQKLIKLLQDNEGNEKSSDQVNEAIQKLSSIRAKSAIPQLVKYLSYERTFESKQKQDPNEVTHWDYVPISSRYPAVGALFQIGEPALPDLAAVIEKEDIESLKSKNALETIQLIFRDDLFKGIKYLERLTTNSANQAKKQRLSYAVEKAKMLCQRQDDCRIELNKH